MDGENGEGICKSTQNLLVEKTICSLLSKFSLILCPSYHISRPHNCKICDLYVYHVYAGSEKDMKPLQRL